jgi:AraC-like DNA-binding protein
MFVKTGFMSYVYSGCETLILFIISLIVAKKGKLLADYILIAWLLVFLMNIFTLFLIGRDGYSPKLLSEKLLFEFSEASIFLHGPFFWFYTLALTQPKFDLEKKYLPHIILFVASFSLLIRGAILEGSVSFNVRKWLILLKMLSLVIYTIAVIIQVRRHRMSIRNIFSNTEEKQLNWIYFLCWGILIIWFVASASLVVSALLNISTPQNINLFPNLAICCFIYLMGFFGVRQNSIFVKIKSPNEPLPVRVNHPGPKEEMIPPHFQKYKRSGLNKAKADNIYIKLMDCMEKQKPYLNPDISLFNLAELLSVQSNHLSQVINEKENQSFFDYINGYRVKAVKEMIVAGKLLEHTLLGIALDCGFNSKASFNRAFKKSTGFTPTEFKNQIGN